MAELVIFHHALGLTDDVVALADTLRAAGHTVHAPDLYDGHTFGTLDEGVAHAESVGFPTILARGRRVTDPLAVDLVYIGLSLGVLPAQLLAQTRPGARGAVLAHSCVPPEEFGDGWPVGVPLQLHMTEEDPLSLPPNGDLAAARAFADNGAELFLYPGSGHLFDAPTTARFIERVHAFLSRLN
ncbi:dienelactone hydrolase family protein [Solirubrobacter phytolaccae]|uniref:Dienelactone hydrolase family protein n=1 Tax=Solirubrobacter phytolaccae TaxID=1404360 RepID=A0A9X3N9Y4_9ACTN|nr:dienelactone hydrolase family protein [Solirubrobacter phytolaccae]MDA0182116.1 dienelactone hydrolase family protein [Solirubrobacter phytolaccae]